jgi:hypothetical protein
MRTRDIILLRAGVYGLQSHERYQVAGISSVNMVLWHYRYHLANRIRT